MLVAEKSSSRQRNPRWRSTTSRRPSVRKALPCTGWCMVSRSSSVPAPASRPQSSRQAKMPRQSVTASRAPPDPGDDFFHGPAAQHVLDDGQGHGADAAAADGLHGAPEQQGPDGLGQGQEQAGDHIEQGARVKHGLAAVFVAERAPEEHGGPEEQQKAGDAQAGEGVRGLQGLRHVRQGRQVHVGGKGREGAQEGEVGNQPAVAGGKNFFGHTGTPCPRVNEGVVPC